MAMIISTFMLPDVDDDDAAGDEEEHGGATGGPQRRLFPDDFQDTFRSSLTRVRTHQGSETLKSRIGCCYCTRIWWYIIVSSKITSHQSGVFVF
jgi:hypothetical protein